MSENDIADIGAYLRAGRYLERADDAGAANAKRELGYNPRPLRGGLQETLAQEIKLLGIK